MLTVFLFQKNINLYCVVKYELRLSSVAVIVAAHLNISAQVGFAHRLSCKVEISFSQLAPHPSCCSSHFLMLTCQDRCVNGRTGVVCGR